MSQKIVRIALLFCLPALLSAIMSSHTLAQTNNFGAIKGSVQEGCKHGPRVPAATVTTENLETGEIMHSPSNDEGEYFFRLLQPGRYKITAEAASAAVKQDRRPTASRMPTDCSSTSASNRSKTYG
jgi:hypothetical protein